MKLSDLNTADRKMAEDMQGLCAAIVGAARRKQAQPDTTELWLDRTLEDMLMRVFRFSQLISSGRPAHQCWEAVDMALGDEQCAFMAELLHPLGIGMAKVIIMTNPSREGIHTLDDLRAFCAKVKMHMPYHQIMFYLEGSLEAIVADMKDPKISSDMEVITIFN